MSFIHPKSEVDSKARLGKNIYVGAFACVRADEGEVSIGDNTSIQEGCIIHGSGVKIGKNVTVGHGAIIHGCQISDNVLIGMNATLLDGCKIGEWSIVAAGAVVTGNTEIPPKSLVAGVPAKVLREVNEKDIELIKKSAENYLEKLAKMGKQD
ncbi:MAG: gamma carbonic anhydrase family protein [Candidatus Micrarchaeota archaeon]|nr:gamma carbonic anhydrase family protein [Candidatus Micrarchaeota archaeon]